jgi:hypothetical protein
MREGPELIKAPAFFRLSVSGDVHASGKVSNVRANAGDALAFHLHLGEAALRALLRRPPVSPCQSPVISRQSSSGLVALSALAGISIRLARTGKRRDGAR